MLRHQILHFIVVFALLLNQVCGFSGGSASVELPPELVGTFIGREIFFNKGKVTKICSTATFKPDGSLVWWWQPNKRCKDLNRVNYKAAVRTQNLGDVFIERVIEVECTGLGKGRIVIEDSVPNTYYCDVFERKGNKLYITYGEPKPSPDEAICPKSARTDPITDPDTQGRVVFIAQTPQSILSPKKYACK